MNWTFSLNEFTLVKKFFTTHTIVAFVFLQENFTVVIDLLQDLLNDLLVAFFGSTDELIWLDV